MKRNKVFAFMLAALLAFALLPTELIKVKAGSTDWDNHANDVLTFDTNGDLTGVKFEPVDIVNTATINRSVRSKFKLTDFTAEFKIKLGTGAMPLYNGSIWPNDRATGIIIAGAGGGSGQAWTDGSLILRFMPVNRSLLMRGHDGTNVINYETSTRIDTGSGNYYISWDLGSQFGWDAYGSNAKWQDAVENGLDLKVVVNDVAAGIREDDPKSLLTNESLAHKQIDVYLPGFSDFKALSVAVDKPAYLGDCTIGFFNVCSGNSNSLPDLSFGPEFSNISITKNAPPDTGWENHANDVLTFNNGNLTGVKFEPVNIVNTATINRSARSKFQRSDFTAEFKIKLGTGAMPLYNGSIWPNDRATGMIIAGAGGGSGQAWTDGSLILRFMPVTKSLLVRGHDGTNVINYETSTRTGGDGNYYPSWDLGSQFGWDAYGSNAKWQDAVENGLDLKVEVYDVAAGKREDDPKSVLTNESLAHKQINVYLPQYDNFKALSVAVDKPSYLGDCTIGFFNVCSGNSNSLPDLSFGPEFSNISIYDYEPPAAETDWYNHANDILTFDTNGDLTNVKFEPVDIVNTATINRSVRSKFQRTDFVAEFKMTLGTGAMPLYNGSIWPNDRATGIIIAGAGGGSGQAWTDGSLILRFMPVQRSLMVRGHDGTNVVNYETSTRINSGTGNYLESWDLGSQFGWDVYGSNAKWQDAVENGLDLKVEVYDVAAGEREDDPKSVRVDESLAHKQINVYLPQYDNFKALSVAVNDLSYLGESTIGFFDVCSGNANSLPDLSFGPEFSNILIYDYVPPVPPDESYDPSDLLANAGAWTTNNGGITFDDSKLTMNARWDHARFKHKVGNVSLTFTWVPGSKSYSLDGGLGLYLAGDDVNSQHYLMNNNDNPLFLRFGPRWSVLQIKQWNYGAQKLFGNYLTGNEQLDMREIWGYGTEYTSGSDWYKAVNTGMTMRVDIGEYAAGELSANSMGYGGFNPTKAHKRIDVWYLYQSKWICIYTTFVDDSEYLGERYIGFFVDADTEAVFKDVSMQSFTPFIPETWEFAIDPEYDLVKYFGANFVTDMTALWSESDFQMLTYNTDGSVTIKAARGKSPAMPYRFEKLGEQEIRMIYKAYMSMYQDWDGCGNYEYSNFTINVRFQTNTLPQDLTGFESINYGGAGAPISIFFGAHATDLVVMNKTGTDHKTLVSVPSNFCDGVKRELYLKTTNLAGGVNIRMVIDGIVVFDYDYIFAGDSNYWPSANYKDDGYFSINLGNELCEYPFNGSMPGTNDYLTIYNINVSGIGNPTLPTGVTLNKNALTLKIGEFEKLTASVLPAGTMLTDLIWETSDINVASVSSLGTVTALFEGTAVITVRTKYGDFVASCTVTVTPDETTAGPGTETPKKGCKDKGSAAAFLLAFAGAALIIFKKRGC